MIAFIIKYIIPNLLFLFSFIACIVCIIGFLNKDEDKKGSLIIPFLISFAIVCINIIGFFYH